MLIQTRLHLLNRDMLLTEEDDQAKRARLEYQAILDFADWVTQLGQDTGRKSGVNLEIKKNG